MYAGFIADGNRRWAKERGLSTKQGHTRGFQVLKDEVIPSLYDHPNWDGLAVYAFSTENWKRSPLEVKNLIDLFQECLTAWLPDMQEKKIRLLHAGRDDRLPSKLKQALLKAQEDTAHDFVFTLWLCLDYGSRDEIVRASSQGSIEQHLEVPDLDLIIRTGGDMRLSNFCLWQAAYAQLHFTPTFLPDMTRKECEEILDSFSKQERRMGA